MVRRELDAPVVEDGGRIPDAEQTFVRGVHLRAGEIDVVGGHDRDVARVGEAQELRFQGGVGVRAVAMQLHVQPIRKHRLQALKQGVGGFRLAGRQQLSEGARRRTGQRDHAVGVVGQVPQGHDRRPRAASLQVHLRDQPLEAVPTGLGGRKQQDRCARPLQRIRELAVLVRGEFDQRAGDGLNPGPARCERELERAEQVGMVREGQRRHRIAGGELHEIGDLDGPFGQRVG